MESVTTYCQARYLPSGRLSAAVRDAPNSRIHAPKRFRIHAPNNRIHAPNRFRIHAPKFRIHAPKSLRIQAPKKSESPK